MWALFKPLPAFATGILPVASQAVQIRQQTSGLPLLGRGIAGAFALLYLVTKIFSSTSAPPKKKLGVWNRGKAADEGYSHELLPWDYERIIEGGKTDLENLKSEPFPGCDTIFKAM